MILRRPTLVAALVYAALAIILLIAGLLPGRTISTADSLRFAPPFQVTRPPHLQRITNNEVGDSVLQFQPLAALARQSFPALWDPYLMDGVPLLADDQSAVLSPFTLPAYVMPLLRSLAVSAALKLMVAALGVFVLARALGLRFAAALLAGLVYGFSFWQITWVQYPHAGVWALFGWVLWGLHRALAAPGRRSVVALAVPVGLQFLAGHFESSFDTAVGAAVLGLLWAIGRRRSGGLRTAPALATVAAGVALGTALAALLLVPFGESLLGSADLPQRAGTAIDSHLALRGLLQLFLPDYWGRATQAPLISFIRAQAYYAGALPLLLVAVALAVRPSRERIGLALLGFTGLAVAVGIPPFVQIVTRLPGFSSGHDSRLIPWTTLAIALLAAAGLEEVRRAAPARLRRATLGACVVAIVPVVWVLARGELGGAGPQAALLAVRLHRANGSTSAGTIHLAALLGWVGLAALALVLIRWGGRLPRNRLVVLVLALTVLDLFRAGMGYNPSVAEADARVPTTGAIRFLLAHRNGRFQSVEPVPWNIIALHFKLPEAGGYDLPIPHRYDHLWRTQVDPEHPSQVGATFADIPLIVPRVQARRLHTLRLLGVRWLLTAPGGPVLRLAGLRIAYAGADGRVYEVADAQPRVAVVGATRTVPNGEAAFRAVTQLGFDGTRSVVLERAAPGPALTAPGPAGSAAVGTSAATRVVVRADASRPGTLVLDDRWAAGWRATVDGHQVPDRQVDYVLQGVALTPGRHEVVFTYRPLSWRVGWIVSLAGLAAVLVLGAGGWKWRRR